MFLKLSEFVKPSNALSGEYRAIVVENTDPKKLGRVKCKVEGLLESDTDSLPWVFPLSSTGLGGKPDSSGFCVPEINSEIVVVFPTRDIYAPFYVGYWQSTKTHQTDFDDDYPDTYGWRDSKGNKFKVNKASGLVEFEHKSGTKIKVKDDGEVILILKGSNLFKVGSESSSERAILGDLFMALFNAHTHNVTGIGTPTAPPIPLMTDLQLSDKVKTEK